MASDEEKTTVEERWRVAHELVAFLSVIEVILASWDKEALLFTLSR